jgi:hypothetical protein
MKKIIAFLKGLFGFKKVEVKHTPPPRPQTKSKPTTVRPTPKSVEIKKEIELSEDLGDSPKPKKKKYYRPKPKNGGTSNGGGKKPQNIK